MLDVVKCPRKPQYGMASGGLVYCLPAMPCLRNIYTWATSVGRTLTASSFPPYLFLLSPSTPSSLLLCHVLFCPELPLILFDCGYEGIDWQESTQSSQRIIAHFQEQWTSLAVKTTMVSRMLDTLTASHQQRSGPSDPAVANTQLSTLMSERILQTSYKPLLARPTAGECTVTIGAGGWCTSKIDNLLLYCLYTYVIHSIVQGKLLVSPLH